MNEHDEIEKLRKEKAELEEILKQFKLLAENPNGPADLKKVIKLTADIYMRTRKEEGYNKTLEKLKKQIQEFNAMTGSKLILSTQTAEAMIFLIGTIISPKEMNSDMSEVQMFLCTYRNRLQEDKEKMFKNINPDLSTP